MKTALLSLLIFAVISFYLIHGYLKSLKWPLKKLLVIFGISLSIMISGFIIMWQRQLLNYGNVSTGTNILISLSVVVFLAFFFSTIFFFIDDIIRFIRWIIKSIKRKRFSNYILRSKASGIVALSFNILLFTLIMYGTLIGFTHYKVHNVQLKYENVPAAFDGFKIAQISDMHLGTFGSKRQVEKGLKILQEQNPDMIVFTGDLVNNLSTEAEPYIEMMKKISAPYGKYAVLGNHDYAHYANDLTKSEMEKDVEKLRQIIESMGYKMMRNEHEVIRNNSDSIILAGVENWGVLPFPQYGDLDKAMDGVQNNNFVILLSHDPSHWEEQVISFPVNIELTLSGHTHGMQFGFEVGGYKWSPVQYRYGKWAGLYQDNKKYLYVNRGFGGIGFPGRVGIRPEITVIELKSKN